MNRDVTVTMTFDEHSITACEVDVSGETLDIGGKIGGEMNHKILTAQSSNVDGVAAATVTAYGVRPRGGYFILFQQEDPHL